MGLKRVHIVNSRKAILDYEKSGMIMARMRPADEFSTQEERTDKTKSEIPTDSAGGTLYNKETLGGKRVFTLRAARKYDLTGLRNVIDYMITSGKLDRIENEKDAYTFQNIIKVLREKAPLPTKEQEEAAARVVIDFKMKYPGFFGEQEYEEDGDNA